MLRRAHQPVQQRRWCASWWTCRRTSPTPSPRTSRGCTSASAAPPASSPPGAATAPRTRCRAGPSPMPAPRRTPPPPRRSRPLRPPPSGSPSRPRRPPPSGSPSPPRRRPRPGCGPAAHHRHLPGGRHPRRAGELRRVHRPLHRARLGGGGHVTATIRDQPWDVALQSILRAYGLAAQELPSGIIQVDDIETLQERADAGAAGHAHLPRQLRPRGRARGDAASRSCSERGRISVERLHQHADRHRRGVGGGGPRADGARSWTSARRRCRSRPRSSSSTARTWRSWAITYDLKDSQGNSLNRLTSVPDPADPGQLHQRRPGARWAATRSPRSATPTCGCRGRSCETVISLVLGRYTLVSFIDALQSAELSDVQAAPLITTLDNQEARDLGGRADAHPGGGRRRSRRRGGAGGGAAGAARHRASWWRRASACG